MMITDRSPLTERYSFRLSDMYERSPYPGRGAANKTK